MARSRKHLAVLTDVGDVDVVVTCVRTGVGVDLVLRPKYSRRPVRVPLSDLARKLLEGGEVADLAPTRPVPPGDDPGQMWLILPVPPGSRLEGGPAAERERLAVERERIAMGAWGGRRP